MADRQESVAAINTVTAEIDALIVLKAELERTAAVSRFCDVIFFSRGKTIVTGMGKAGWIGQKISATLRSTGQPSAFLDPAQALHGDMGLLEPGDCLIAISNSGETTEVLSVVMFCQKSGIPVLTLTSRADSPLATIADYSFVYPLMPEGCPIRRAPMASCVMQLAIGDAIASELMVRRGFTEADFLTFHHGGYLGRMLAEQLG